MSEQFQIIPKMVFGIKSDEHLIQNVVYVSPDVIIHTAANYVVSYNIKQTLLSATEGSMGFCALTPSHSKTLLAVAEKSESPLCSVIDINTFPKRKKNFTSADIRPSEFRCMAFSKDDKLLVLISEKGCVVVCVFCVCT